MTWTFPFISCTPTDPCISQTCYTPISPVPFHVPYFPEFPRLFIFSKRLLHNYYEDTFITFNCLQCSKEGQNLRRTTIQKMPPILVLHLNRFEWAISATKKQNFVDFPVEGLSLRAHILSDRLSASYSLCAVSNHFGTLSGGHYTSYWRPPHGNVWHICDDRSVSRLRTPVKTSAAYSLFYNSLQNVWVLILVPMVLLLLWCESWGGRGTAWCLWVGKGWGIDAWHVVGRGDGGSPAAECGLSSALVFSLYPLDQLSPSHTSRISLCPLFPTITTLVHPWPDAESCCSTSHPVAGCWSLP